MIEQSLTLPCGATLSNRICKAAMTEGLAGSTGVPGAALNQLYGIWSDGGAGLLLSGNVQIDRDHLERPGNVVVDEEPDAATKEALKAWATAGTRSGNHFWAQISHAGRQCQKIINPTPKAPSPIKLGLPAVGPDFPVGVKLNSADFQRGGFDFTESLQVAKWLEAAGVDLLEISGGTYEQPRLLNVEGIEPIENQAIAQSTRAREAYFVDFAQAMRKELTMPLMVTGGLRRLDAMESALESGSADVVGIGRPMCVMTDAPKRLLAGMEQLPRYEDALSLLPGWLKILEKISLFKTLGTFAVQYWYYEQILLLGEQGKTSDDLSVFAATRRQMKLANDLAAAR